MTTGARPFLQRLYAERVVFETGLHGLFPQLLGNILTEHKIASNR
jgi:hypothetical protein